MAGVAVVGFDGAFAVGAFVLAIVTTETARPIFMADVVGIDLPVRLHFGKKLSRIDLLHGIDCRFDPSVAGITAREAVVAMPLSRLRFVRIARGSDAKTALVLMYGNERSILSRAMARFTALFGDSISVRRPVVAIHAVHPPEEDSLTAFVNLAIRNSVTTPWTSVMRTHGIF